MANLHHPHSFRFDGLIESLREYNQEQPDIFPGPFLTDTSSGIVGNIPPPSVPPQGTAQRVEGPQVLRHTGSGSSSSLYDHFTSPRTTTTVPGLSHGSSPTGVRREGVRDVTEIEPPNAMTTTPSGNELTPQGSPDVDVDVGAKMETLTNSPDQMVNTSFQLKVEQPDKNSLSLPNLAHIEPGEYPQPSRDTSNRGALMQNLPQSFSPNEPYSPETASTSLLSLDMKNGRETLPVLEPSGQNTDDIKLLHVRLKEQMFHLNNKLQTLHNSMNTLDSLTRELEQVYHANSLGNPSTSLT